MKEGLKNFLLRFVYFFILMLIGVTFVLFPLAKNNIDKSQYVSMYFNEVWPLIALVLALFLTLSSIKYWKGYIFGGILVLFLIVNDLINMVGGGNELTGLASIYAIAISPFILVFGYGIYFISSKYEKAKSDHKKYYLAIPFAIELILALLILFI